MLGIHDGHDAGVVLLEDGNILYAANEERFSRTKFHWGFPHLSLQNLFAVTGISPSSITKVAVSGQSVFENPQSAYALDPKDMSFFKRHGQQITDALGSITDTKPFAWLVKRVGMMQRDRGAVSTILRGFGIRAPIQWYDHHACHAAGAYFTSGKDPALVMTADFSGDGRSGTISVGRNGRLHAVAESPVIHSAGRFWDVITLLCGFKPPRHAGKITGLAAYKPSPAAHEKLRSLYGGDPKNLHFLNKERKIWHHELTRIKEILPNASREELAYAAQKVLEEAFCSVLKAAIQKTGIHDVALAGGTFANVRLNQKLAELPDVQSLYVFPNMGDGGLAMGAAFLETSRHLPLKPFILSNLYFGPHYPEQDIRRAAALHRLPLEPLRDPADFIARELRAKRVVGVYEGRMEFGPRALGHRSILAEPTDPTMMDWLNKRLERTDFMPFAPIIKEEAAPRYFSDFRKNAYPARFMTICFDVTEEARQKAPGIVHKDGTARPQTVSAREQPLIYAALTRHEELTGLPLCINTSFNKHEEPIVCEPEDAVKEFLRGGVDTLVMEGFAARSPARGVEAAVAQQERQHAALREDAAPARIPA